MPGTRTKVAYLCMPGFVNASVRTVTCCEHETARNTGTSSRPSNGGTGPAGVEDSGTEEESKQRTQKTIRGIVLENGKNNGTSHVQDEMSKLMHHDEQELLSLWERWHWDDNQGGWLDPELCAKSAFFATRCTPDSPVRRACVRRERRPLKQDGRRLTRDSQGSPTCARWVAKEWKTHAWPELDASTPPLEALKAVLSEVATGKRGGKVVALVDVLRTHFYAPSRRRAFVELPPEDYEAGDEHTFGLLQYSLYGTRDAAQNWEEEVASTFSDLKLTRGIACPCVRQGYIKDEHIVATVHGDDITIDGERSAMEFLIKMISRNAKSRTGRN